MKDDKEILALTGLRFVAAFYVFVFHIHIRWPVTGNAFLSGVFSQGAVGMSLFFVLSGFVLAYRYADGRTGIRAYLVNRFARIYPVYAAAALVTLPWIGVSFPGGSMSELGKALAQAGILVFANIFLIQAWFPQFFDYWNDGGSWSISVEAFCYILLPFLLSQLVRLSVRRLVVVGFVCYVLAVLPGVVGVIFPGAPRGVYYSMPIYRLPEFLMGVCSYLVFRKSGADKFNQFQQLAFLGVVVAYLGYFGGAVQNYVGHNWIIIPFIVYMICTLARGKGILASLLSTPILVWFGKISYCFYAFQALVILTLIRFHDPIVQVAPVFSDNTSFLILALGLLVALSAVGYYLIEEPARKWIRQTYA